MTTGQAPDPRARGLHGTLQTIDAILRGGAAAASVGSGPLLRLVLALGAFYGACLGIYGVFHGGDQPWLQLLSASVKLPLLFPLTLLVTMPSLYVFGALLDSPLARGSTLRLLLVMAVVHTAVLASLGPVFVFFAASTKSYPFLLLLNVAFAVVGGVVSLHVLRGAGARPAQEGAEPGARPSGLPVAWCVLYGAVGAQMAWLLRPFLGAPGHEFAWLRPRDSSFFETVLRTLAELLRG